LRKRGKGGITTGEELENLREKKKKRAAYDQNTLLDGEGILRVKAETRGNKSLYNSVNERAQFSFMKKKKFD